MFPALPDRKNHELELLSDEVRTLALSLGKGLNPILAHDIAEFMLRVNSYYTNAMEGNPSKLKDIEDALNDKLLHDSVKRNFQIEHLAHIEAQRKMLLRLEREPELSVCSPDFLCWLHAIFYEALPPEMRVTETETGRTFSVIPGKIRDRGVVIGRHHPPETRDQVVAALGHFENAYEPRRIEYERRPVALAASHHRLLWIHPFTDGNGRVARLFTQAYAVRIGIHGDLLWTPSRAFARNRIAYDDALAKADRERRNDFDGRGPLSEEDLSAFCRFFLADCCVDQLRFMTKLMRPDALELGLKKFIAMKLAEGGFSKHLERILKQILFRGEIPRGEVAELCRVKQRQASNIVADALESGHVRSASPYGPLRLRITAELAGVLFPDLA